MNDSPPLPPVSPLAAPVIHPSGLSAEERNWAMIGHLSALSMVVTGFGNIVGPLIVWLIKKETSPFAAQEAKEALNFNLTWTLATLVVFALSLPLMLVLVGFFTIWLAGLFPLIGMVLSVVAGIAAGEGRAYRYPLTIRFIK